MRRVVNFRVALFAAIGLGLGIFSFYEYLFGDFWFGLIAVILLVALGVVAFALKSKIWVGLLAVLLAVISGFALAHLNYEILARNEVNEKNVLITGRVCDLNRNGVENGAVYMEHCVDSDGVKYAGRIETYIFDGEINSGDIVTIRGTLNSTYPVKSTVETYDLRANIRYELDTKLLVSRQSGDLYLNETIRKYIYDVSTEYAPQNGDVLYALLTGDRSALNSEKEEYFKSAGIIHLLAVSGLHVGFVVAVVCFILKRFKLHPLLECCILLVPLIFYAYICNFSPSVIRAIVMVVCSYFARAVFGKYDLLTSLSMAIIVILLISPFSLFDVGFQLSALSVYGIATLYGSINRLFTKRKIHKVLKYFLNSLAISLSCSFATFFTLQLNYGYAPTLGILLNLVVIPLVTVVFVLSWVGMLPWIFHYVLWVIDWLLEAVVIAARWIASLSFATVSISTVAVTVVVIALWLFVLGGYVNLRKVGKIVVNSALACVVALCVGLSLIKVQPQTQAFVSYGYNDVICVATSDDGEAAIVGNFGDSKAYIQAVNYINKYKITNCVLYITDYSATNPVIVDDALKSLPINSAYKLDFAYNAAVDDIFDNYGITLYQQMENNLQGNEVNVRSIYDGGLRAVLLQTDRLTVAMVYGNEFAVANYLKLNIYADIYALPRANNAYAAKGLTTLSRYQSSLLLNYGANKYGNFTITQKGDTIKVKFR